MSPIASAQLPLTLKGSHDYPICIDLFCGGGGASLGIETALGRPVDIAVNHSPQAIAIHMANHMRTIHLSENVLTVNAKKITNNKKIELLWASPDCTHFSSCRGSTPVLRHIRSLAWVVLKYGTLPEAVRPDVIVIENVEAFAKWGPCKRVLDKKAIARGVAPADAWIWIADPKKRGQTFRWFLHHLAKLGYQAEFRELSACDYGAPTIRNRFFLIARRDSQPIVWPKPTHGPVGSGLLPYRTIAECIDWSIRGNSIFLDKAAAKHANVKRPLADTSLDRIFYGLKRNLYDTSEPFIVPTGAKATHRDDRGLSVCPGLVLCNHAGSGYRGQDIRTPMRTITAARDAHGLTIAKLLPVDEVEGLIQKHGSLTIPYLVPRYGERPNQLPRSVSVSRPSPVIVPTGNGGSLIEANIVPLDSPNAKRDRATLYRINQVREFLSALATKHGLTGHPIATGIIEIAGKLWAIIDITLRMLEPEELKLAQGFPPGYILTHGADGTPVTKTAQSRLIGNSVCPDVAKAIIAANCTRTPRSEMPLAA